MNTVIWWIRRDLRLIDNAALKAADPQGRLVLPVFVLDPVLLDKEAPRRKAFLIEGLRRLADDLRHCGSRLIVRSGSPLDELTRLVQETGASAIYTEEDYSPYARRRDETAARHLPLRLVAGLTFHHPLSVVKQGGTPYTVFTPFSKAWKALSPPAAVDELPPHFFQPPPPDLTSVNLPPTEGSVKEFPAGGEEASRRLERFFRSSVGKYHLQRDRLDLDGTSQLSPYLHFGMLSIRRVIWRVQQIIQGTPNPQVKKGAETWLNELIWREFYHSILYHFPFVQKEAFRSDLRRFPWRDSALDLEAWKYGRTGYPVVDAAMRQLLATGWMHNRGRMIAASFLVKDLLINWQEGERWFMQQLVDGDLAANNGGWQWTAGVGTDAAPYFRIFNPILQGMKFDPEGDYIRRWVPELAPLPLPYVHEPWRLTADLQQRYGCRLGVTYPYPIVDHAAARERALAAYQSARNSA